jgi:outer membrane protein assembly factor BamB
MILSTAGLVAQAADQPQWGQQFTRNMISDERALPDSFEPGYRSAFKGTSTPSLTSNLKWVAQLGSQTYGTPIVAEGRVLVGTNNDVPRDKRLRHDAGVLMCFNEISGDFLWQLVVPKLTEIRYGDFYRIGLTASPVVEGGFVYVVSNRAEVLCLDLDGMADGNGGPVLDEAARSVRPGDEPVDQGEKGADIVWAYDMVASLGVQPHNAANCSILSVGDHLYICTSNGVNSTHSYVANPTAPTLIVLDKKTGALVAKDNFGIGEDVIHGQWSNPTLARMGDTVRIFQGAGNGVLYACAPAPAGTVPPAPLALEKAWWANAHPAAQTQDTVTIEHGHRSKNFEVIGTPVFHNNRIYTAVTQDPFHRHREGVLTCYKADGTGDVTRSNLIWSYPGVGACSATASIADGLVYVGGHDGRLHCLNAETGELHWVHDAEGPIWGSTLVADGKVYVGTERRIFWILKHDKTPTVLARIAMPNSICSTPIAANGALYIATARELYAVVDRTAQARLAVEAVRAEQEAKKAADAKPTPPPTPEPGPQPEPKPEPAPVTGAQPEPVPQPAIKPEPAPQPEGMPAPKPELVPAPEPKPEAAPQPAPKPETAPQPASTPEPKLEPAPKPEPQPAPAPEPKPEPAPQPEPTPETPPPPAPQSTPAPQPETPPKPEPTPQTNLDPIPTP